MLPRNMWFSKLKMEEKGKVVTIERNDEEEEPPTYVEEIEQEGKEDI